MAIGGPTKIGPPPVAPSPVRAQAASEALSPAKADLLRQHKSRVDDLCARLRMANPGADVEPLRKAGYVMAEISLDAVRWSGVPRFEHLHGTAELMLSAGVFDGTALTLGYLHDLQEEHAQWPEYLKMIDLTPGAAELFKAFARPIISTEVKILSHSSSDIRPVVVKLADRLYNQEDYRAARPWVRERKSRETRMFYAPIAQKLGFWDWRCRLYDTTMRDLEPHDFHKLEIQRNHLMACLEAQIKEAEGKLRSAVLGFKARVIHSPRCLWDVRAVSKKRSFSLRMKPKDILSYTIVIDAEQTLTAVQALSEVCGRLKLVKGSLRDFLDSPQGGYRIGLPYDFRGLFADFMDGDQLRVQITTEKLYRMAMVGVAAESATDPLWHKKGTDFIERVLRLAVGSRLDREGIVELAGFLAGLNDFEISREETTKRGLFRRFLGFALPG